MTGGTRKATLARRRELLMLAVSACCAQAAGAMPLPPQARMLSLERDCPGCAEGSRLQLCRNGTARLSRLGKARFGGQERHSRASWAPTDFDALVAQLRQLGLATLAASHEDEPALQDGSWLLLRIEWAEGPALEVFCRGDVPPALQALIDAIEAAQARLNFVPEGAGATG